MSYERWGSLSVKDHHDTAALVTNVLLYDRLIIPVPASKEEEKRWENNHWNPDLLHRRLGQLEGLTVKKPWDEYREVAYKSKLRELNNLGHDTKNTPYQTTRMVLAQEQVVYPPGVTHVEPVIGYNSTREFSKDFATLQKTGLTKSIAGALFGQKILVPDEKDPEESLHIAINLSKSKEFKSKRSAFYEWQHNSLSRGVSMEKLVPEMNELLDQYNACVQAAHKKVVTKLAFTMATVGTAIADMLLGSHVAGYAAMVTVLQFYFTESQPQVEADRCKPAAMFHAMKAAAIWK